MKKSAFLLVNLLFATVLAGCAGQIINKTGITAAVPDDAVSLLPVYISDVLSAQSGDLVLPVEQGRFSGTTLIAEGSYFAASGRTCRRVFFEGGGDEQRYIACQQDGSWQLVRSVI